MHVASCTGATATTQCIYLHLVAERTKQLVDIIHLIDALLLLSVYNNYLHDLPHKAKFKTFASIAKD
ncbi:MAG: hypothetical protein ACI8RU_001258 [Zhongshania aliphaticivorans]